MRATVRRAYLPALDGLRGIAVLLVLWSHVPNTMPGYPEWLLHAGAFIEPGYLGVDLFFVLSGFLITRILLAEREQGVSLRWFMLRRLLRIFPAYYLLLAVVAVVRPGPELPWTFAYLGNVFFTINEVQSPLRHTWSLCVEEHFYLLWPWLVTWVPPRRLATLLAGVLLPAAVVGAAIAAAWWEPQRLGVAMQYLSPFRFLSIGIGCYLAFVEVRRAGEAPAAVPGPFASARWPRGRTTALALALLAVAAAISETHLFVLLPTGYAPFSGRFEPILPLQYGPFAKLLGFAAASTACFLLVANARRGGPLANLLASAPLRAIGRISYGLYLYHLPVYWLVLRPAPSPGRALLAGALSIIVATASYLAFERPLLRYAARFR